MDCVNCGAPLPPKSSICSYCSTLNDLDLRAVQSRARKIEDSERTCPRCKVRMQTIDLREGEQFLVERCEKCLGIFFDPSELEELLDSSVTGVHDVDSERLETLIEEEVDTSRTVSYVPCPDCGKLMNRKNYGTRAGVIVDVCRKHGIWLDGGELGALLKWVKAGGKLHHGRASAERDRLDQRTQRQKEHLARVRELRTDPEFRRRERFDRSPLENALGALFQMMR